MPKGLDYLINVKDGDFSGISNAKSGIEGIDTAVEETEGGLNSLRGTLTEIGGALAGVFAVEKIEEFGKESLGVYRSTEQAAAQVAAGIKSTAGVAGESLDELREKAEALEGKTLFTEAQTLNADAMLLTFTNIRGKVFDEAIPAIEDLATRMGGDGPADLKGASIQVGKALQDPITGIAALHRVGVSFNDQQKEQIATLVKHGEVAQADAIILKELNNEFGGSAAAARGVLGPSADLNVELEEMKKGFGKLIDEGLRVVVPLILDTIHGIEGLSSSLSDGYHWISDNADIFKALGLGIGTAATAYAILNPNIILGTVATAAQTLVLGGLEIATNLATAAQWALNVAMDANPVGLIITGLALLVAGVYEAYQRSETFRAVLAGIGEVAEDLVPIFKGLGETILGALTFNPVLVAEGFKDAYDGIKKVIDEGGISASFNKGYDASIAESRKADADREKQSLAANQPHGSASDLVTHPGDKNTPYSITTGGRGGRHRGGGETASLTGGRQVRNVTVTINKLVERFELHTTNIQGAGAADLKRMVAEVLTEAVHDSELALGSQ